VLGAAAVAKMFEDGSTENVISKKSVKIMCFMCEIFIVKDKLKGINQN
jgi:hypothetical protein